MSTRPRKQVCCCLSLLVLITLVQIHFLGDPCLVHREHTAHPLASTLSVRAMTCLCFFHAVYAPMTVAVSAFPLELPLVVYYFPSGDMPLVAFDIFHPPRA